MLTFGNSETEKNKLYRHKTPNKISNKISFGERNYKYFIGYLYNDDKVKPLHIMHPKISAYVKSYNRQTKWMYFLIEDCDFLEKHNTI